jgi:hypothetical protein
LKAGLWVRRARLAIVAPDLRHFRRSQADFPLIDLSEFGQPPLIDENLGAADVDLTADELARIEEELSQVSIHGNRTDEDIAKLREG